MGALPFDRETQHWAHTTCSGLRNLAIEPDNAKRLASANATAPLVGLLERASDSLRVASVSCITAIALVDEEAAVRAVQFGVLPVAFEMLNDDENDMVRFTAVKLVNELARRPTIRARLVAFERPPGALSSRMEPMDHHEPSLARRAKPAVPPDSETSDRHPAALEKPRERSRGARRGAEEQRRGNFDRANERGNGTWQDCCD